MKDLLKTSRAVEARLREIDTPRLFRLDNAIAADIITALCTALEAAQKDAERLQVLVRDAFTEGYFSCTTYNDTETSDCDEEWRKYYAAIKAQGDAK